MKGAHFVNTNGKEIMKRNLIASAMLSAALATPAAAADIYNQGGGLKDDVASQAPAHAINWTGIYIGGQVGYGNSNHNLNGTVTESTCEGTVASDGQCYKWRDLKKNYETGVFTPNDGAVPISGATIDTTEIGSAFIDGINSHGGFGGGTIGADVQRGHFVFGVFGDYDFSSAKAQAGLAFGGVSANASIEDGDSWLVAGRAGYLFGEEKRAMLYILGGYGQQDVSYHAGDFNKDLTFSGLVAGAGGEYALGRNLFLGIEWQHFFGGKETVFDSGFLGCEADRLKITDDMDSDKVMAKLKLKLDDTVPYISD